MFCLFLFFFTSFLCEIFCLLRPVKTVRSGGASELASLCVLFHGDEKSQQEYIYEKNMLILFKG